MAANPALVTTNPTLGSGYGTAEINLEPLFTEQSGVTATTSTNIFSPAAPSPLLGSDRDL